MRDLELDTDPRSEPSEENRVMRGERACRSCETRPIHERGLCEWCLDDDDESRFEWRQRRSA